MMTSALRELKEPDFFLDLGFRREEDGVWSDERNVRYLKDFDGPASDLVLQLRLEFSLTVSDSPTASWKENCDYSFEVGNLLAFQRKGPDPHWEWRLSLESVEELGVLIKVLRHYPIPWSP